MLVVCDRLSQLAQNHARNLRDLSQARLVCPREGCTGHVQDDRAEDVSCMVKLSMLQETHAKFRWGSMTPLRQFKGVPGDIVRKAEGKQFVSSYLFAGFNG